MIEQNYIEILESLNQNIKGDVLTDQTSKIIYATDASAYREIPLAVARPKDAADIKTIVQFASNYNFPLIPRAAGTSLAGQVVGNGLVVDVSRYMTKILEFNENERWVRVQPGVILDELNIYLKAFGLFFGPETSSANRCMIGGMVGNNACGSHSLVYGSTRDHTIELKCVLSDSSEVVFNAVDKIEFFNKTKIDGLEGDVYRHINNILSISENREEIKSQYPDPELKRRNTGYALDLLLETIQFSDSDKKFNFCELLAGSEGTLTFTTEIKLNLVPLPPKNKALLCIHCNTLQDSFKANLIALEYKPVAIELIDHNVIERTKDNISQRKNRFFIKGEHRAILIVEFAEDIATTIEQKVVDLENEIRNTGFGTDFTFVTGKKIDRVWDLRKAGLGLLTNIKGDEKPVAMIEDTAVAPKYLPEYLAEIEAMLQKYGKNCVFYAHIATGELHLRPILNLKKKKDVDLFYTIALETAKIVKKYKGSISGEHGDGRLRGTFIPLMYGENISKLFKEIKQIWDPKKIFNPGKIVETPPMNTFLRYKPDKETREINTYFDFSKNLGIIRAIEQCNGSADCRVTEKTGAMMCPSYMATNEESATTRARANLLREILTHSTKNNPFDHKELYEILELCLSCKACKSECPSNVDMTKLKAEFLQNYYDANGADIRSKVIANFPNINKITSVLPSIYNLFVNNRVISQLISKMIGFAPQRTLPKLSEITLDKWMLKNQTKQQKAKKSLYLFVDEFTNYNDAEIGIKAVLLLQAIGFCVKSVKHTSSGRTYLSKGFVKKAKKIANDNVEKFFSIINKNTPLIGIEPSAILTFRDEYPELVDKEKRTQAKELSKYCYTIEEFLSIEADRNPNLHKLFHDERKKIKFHGHCYQKSLSSTSFVKKALSIPKNYVVEEIKSGCCGMAGSFGYEKEHYEISMKVGELVLFPEVRKISEEYVIATSGTSCRTQIKDGTNVYSLHPVEILFGALKK